MAGHSKWANIKHKKGKEDAKKGKIFSKIAKEIISAVKQGGEDPKGNPRLRLALDKAKMANVPNDVIQRNIKKAADKDQADFTEMTYELYGHGGVGLIVDAMTDNKNRTASDMRIATNKRGGTIATHGAVSFNFERKGIIQLPKRDVSEDDLFLIVTDAGAEDFEQTDEGFVVVTPSDLLFQVKEAIEKEGIVCEEASLVVLPKNTVEVDEKTRQSNEGLIEWLEANEDVDAVYHNMK